MLNELIDFINKSQENYMNEKSYSWKTARNDLFLQEQRLVKPIEQTSKTVPKTKKTKGKGAVTPDGNRFTEDDKIVIAKRKKKVEFEPRPTLKVFSNNYATHNDYKKGKKKAAVTYGRFNPPTVAHQTIAEELSIFESDSTDCFLFTSNTHNEKNPLDFDTKINLLKESFGELIEIAANPINNPIHLFQLLEQYYDELTIVVGPDRYADFKRMAETYNGKDFLFEKITVINYTNSEVDRDKVSGTLLREALRNQDKVLIEQLIAPNLKHKIDFLTETIKK